MGTCPIPTSEGDKKTKAQTIVQRYDPVSRRVYDIRIECIANPGKTVPASSVCRPCGLANKPLSNCYFANQVR